LSHARILAAQTFKAPLFAHIMILPTSFTSRCAAKLVAFSFLVFSPVSQAATTLWEVTLNFDEFVGQQGGWEARDTNFTYVEYANKSTPAVAPRNYNIIHQTGTDQKTGRPLYSEGNNIADEPLKITTKIYSSAGNAWSRLRGGISNQGISSQMEASSGSSRPGDWGLVSYRIDIPASYDIDAANLGLRLDNVNGSGEFYEWAFVTVNDSLDNPLFDVKKMDDYEANIFSDLSSSTFFNPDGTPKAGGTARPTTNLPRGQTISQFLAGQPAGPASQNVTNGWFAADKHNVGIKDGLEAFDSPSSGTGWTNNVFDVNAKNLGLDETEKINSITVWMGYNDVAFDTDGNGITRSGPNSQIGQVQSITIGATDFTPPIPEPSTLTLFGGALLSLLGRRRRPLSSQ
jgi:hypothetical protein